MNFPFEHAISVFMAFFAIMNPIANTAAFAGLTGDMQPAEQRKIAAKALLITFVIIVLFALLGQSIFHLFGITLAALRITGGILIFVVGYHMLHGEGSTLHHGQESEDSDVAISPLAMPLLAGPGTIATAMSYSAGGWIEAVTAILMFSVLCMITFFCFVFSEKIIALIGDNGLSIITRLMGLILAVIGVEMLIDGMIAVINKLQ